MRTADDGETYPDAGVIVASPATDPVSSPRNFGFLARHPIDREPGDRRRSSPRDRY